jgi:hypothetical protein
MQELGQIQCLGSRVGRRRWSRKGKGRRCRGSRYHGLAPGFNPSAGAQGENPVPGLYPTIKQIFQISKN